jgi:hypothetical protein
MSEGFKPGGAIFGFIHLARTETMQQRAQDASHMRVVVDDEETQTVEIDADHAAPGLGHVCPMPCRFRLPVRR